MRYLRGAKPTVLGTAFPESSSRLLCCAGVMRCDLCAKWARMCEESFCAVCGERGRGDQECNKREEPSATWSSVRA